MKDKVMSDPKAYYAVIFSATANRTDLNDYYETAERMFELAAGIPGYLGVETAHQKDGFGITVSYWESEEAIKLWRDESEHQEARRRGKDEWYQSYHLRVAKIEREYNWQKDKN